MMPIVPLEYKCENTELAILESLLNKPKQFVENNLLLDVDLFTKETHKSIMMEFHKALPNEILVSQLCNLGLISDDHLESIDGEWALHNTALQERIQFLTLLRSRREMYEAICHLVKENAASSDLDSLVNGFMSKVNGIIKKSNLTKSKIISNEGFIDILEKSMGKKQEQLKIGFEDFDSVYKIYRNNLVTIAANTNVGKTWMGLNIYDYAIRNGHVGVFMSTEMSDEQVITRLSQMYAGIWDIDEITYDSFDKIYANMAQSKHNIVYDSRLTVQRVRNTLIELKEKYGRVDYVVIDYLTRMEMPTGKEDYRIKVGAIVKELKTLAGEFNCAIFLLAQLSRKNLERNDKRPIISDLAETKIIEDESDSMMMMYSEEYIRRKITHQQIDHCQVGIMEIDIPKNRHGAMHAGVLLMGQGGKLYQVAPQAKSEYFQSLNNKNK